MNLKSEALLTVGGLGTAITAVIVLLRSFGVPLTDDQQNAINGLVAVLAPIVIGLIGRQFVYAQDTTQQLVDNAAVTRNTDIGTPPDGK